MKNYVVGAVFAFAAIRIFGLYVQDPTNPAIISDPGDYYLLYYSHWENNMISILLSGLILAQSIRFNPCIYTKIAAFVCLFLTLLDTVYLIHPFKYSAYLSIFSFVSWSCVIALALLCMVSPLLKPKK